MTLKEECPYLDKFLRENIYTDIDREYDLKWSSGNTKYGSQIVIEYKNGEKEFTPTSEIDGCPLPIPGPFVLSLFDPFEANRVLEKEVYKEQL